MGKKDVEAMGKDVVDDFDGVRNCDYRHHHIGNWIPFVDVPSLQNHDGQNVENDS